jgi:hypothetical protein
LLLNLLTLPHVTLAPLWCFSYLLRPRKFLSLELSRPSLAKCSPQLPDSISPKGFVTSLVPHQGGRASACLLAASETQLAPLAQPSPGEASTHPSLNLPYPPLHNFFVSAQRFFPFLPECWAFGIQMLKTDAAFCCSLHFLK